MNAVGIDVSKGKSMIAVMRPFGEVVRSPYEVSLFIEKAYTSSACAVKRVLPVNAAETGSAERSTASSTACMPAM